VGRGAPCRPIGGNGVGSPVLLTEPGIGRVCGIGVRASANATNQFLAIPRSSQGSGGAAFTAPDFNVMGLTPADGLVSSLVVEETSGFDLPVCRITLANVDRGLNSTILAKEQTTFSARFGWSNPGLQSHGTFVVQRPRWRFDGGSGAEVDIVAYGEQVRLAATERREVYRKMRDSDIARVIASRHGFEIDADRTDPVHDQVIQANESDYKFLARRARLHGLLVMVEDGVLRFHAPRVCESGIRLTCQNPDGGVESFLNFQVQSRTFQRGLRLHISQIDPVTKEEFEVVSGEAPTDLQRGTRFGNWRDLVSIPGIGQPERFLVGEGHEQRREQLRTQVDRMAEASRFVISGSGTAIGLETLRPQQIITLDNLGRSSGRYVVTRVTHRISGEATEDGYSTRFEVLRSGAESADDPLPGESAQPAVVQSAGSVFASSLAQATLAGF